jgi:Txe/YoeB family toxin of Txe-Axe toxin-antitoxin module
MNQNNFNPVPNNESIVASNPELNSAGIEATPEIVVQATPENTTQIGGPVASTTSTVQQDNTQGVIVDNTNIIEEPTSEVVKNEIKEENSSKVDSDDNSYIKEVKKIIKEESDDPFQELEEAEELEINYLKDRFGVNVKNEEL